MTTPTADMLADPALIDLASQIVDVCWRQALPRAEDQMVDEPSRKAYCVSVAVYGIAEHISSHAAVAAIVQRARRDTWASAALLAHEVRQKHGGQPGWYDGCFEVQIQLEGKAHD